jgi:PAS domain S-box-containing protein
MAIRIASKGEAPSASSPELAYRALFDQNPVPMWVFDPESLRFLAVNEAAVAHYGYSPEEFLSMTIADIRPEEDVPRLLSALTGESEEYWRHRKKGGAIIDVEIVGHDVPFGGKPARLVIVNDLTQRRRMERELRKALEAERSVTNRLRVLDEMMNAFLNAVSHELRTPLSVVLGSAMTLERLGLDLTLDDQRGLLRAITANALKLQRMLADLLDLDRLTRGVLKPRLEAVEIGALIRRVVSDLDFVHDRPVDVQAGAMVFPVDTPKVERIVENLLANAMKYSPPGSPLWIRVQRVTEGAMIAVEDCGPGVPKEMRETIFEPFWQGPNAVAHSPGVGIGLSLVAKFAELHGGRAWVEERSGGGSSFRVLLREPSAPRYDDPSS